MTTIEHAKANLRAAHLVREGLHPAYFKAEDALILAVRSEQASQLAACEQQLVIAEAQLRETRDSEAALEQQLAAARQNLEALRVILGRARYQKGHACDYRTAVEAANDSIDARLATLRPQGEQKDDDHGAGLAAVDNDTTVAHTPELPHDEPFFVEVDKNGCERCGHGKQWTVVGPDGVAIGQSFEDEELAGDIADYMNLGFHAGCGGE